MTVTPSLAPVITVSDHAVLRYLERVHGLDVAHFRSHIAALVTRGVEHGAVGVITEDVKFVLSGAVVVTVLEPHMHTRLPRERAR